MTITMKNGDVITVMVTDAQIKKTIMTASGETWEITVTYGEEAEIPEGAELEAFEVLEGSSVNGKSYEDYVAYTENALGWEAGSALYARVFDISIVDGEGEKIQPAAGSTVDVRIELADADGEGKLNVVHFADEANAGDVVESSTDEQAVSFEAHGFSAYAIVQGPEAVSIGWHKISSVAELIEMGNYGIYIGHPDGYYYGNTTISDSNRIGIKKTKPSKSTPPTDAAKYYFEAVGGTEDQIYVYCYAEDGTTRQYVFNGDNNSLSFTTDENKTAFKVTKNNDGTFKLNHGAWYWNMQGGTGGTRFCAFNNSGDGNNKVYLESVDSLDKFDPFVDIQMELTGMAPYGKLKIDTSASPFQVTVDKSTNLSNGDVVNVTLEEYDLESCINTYGALPARTEMAYVVDGLDEYISEIDRIPDDLEGQMLGQLDDFVVSMYADSDERVLKDYEVLGYYLLTPKADPSNLWSPVYNQLYIVYRADMHETGEDYEEDITAYKYIKYTDLIRYADGTGYVDILNYTNPVVPGLMYTGHEDYYFTSGNNSQYAGFKDLQTLENQCITSQKTEWIVESTVEKDD